MKKVRSENYMDPYMKVPHGWPDGTHAWKVTLKYDRRQLTVPFFTGPLAGEPTTSVVLTALLFDVEGIDAGFWAWAENHCFDPSSAVEKTYEACAALLPRLHRLLGDDYEEFVRLRDHHPRGVIPRCDDW